jgi:hypothetical protein
VLSLVPFPQISAVQLFDQPNFTVALSVTSAVTVPAAVGKINWVFGGGGATGSTAELTAKAAGFNPTCDALDLPVKSVLSWTGGARSSSHDV